MFDMQNYADIAPEDMEELMHEMRAREAELELDALAEWYEQQYPAEFKITAESGCIFNHDHVLEPEMCLVHS
jgi:hypothetical protein